MLGSLPKYQQVARQLGDKFQQGFQISITPGRLFNVHPQYIHCMRLSYGLPFDERVEGGLRQIGKLRHQ